MQPEPCSIYVMDVKDAKCHARTRPRREERPAMNPGNGPPVWPKSVRPANLRRLRVRENVLGLPALQIELGAGRQKLETGVRELDAPLARQHDIEALA
jgi:hypothetical protein